MSKAQADLSLHRALMVEWQLRRREIHDPRVLDAFLEVPRHEFVLPEHLAEAYEDHPLPIGEGQTITQPYMVAVMTEALGLAGNERVLEVGTGSGYQTAILARLARHVYTIERLAPLSARAQGRWGRLGGGGGDKERPPGRAAPPRLHHRALRLVERSGAGAVGTAGGAERHLPGR